MVNLKTCSVLDNSIETIRITNE